MQVVRPRRADWLVAMLRGDRSAESFVSSWFNFAFSSDDDANHFSINVGGSERLWGDLVAVLLNDLLAGARV